MLNKQNDTRYILLLVILCAVIVWIGSRSIAETALITAIVGFSGYIGLRMVWKDEMKDKYFIWNF